MHNFNQDRDASPSGALRRADIRQPLSIALLTDDPATARALLIACEQLPSFDCRVRIGALHDDSGVVAREGEVVIYDAANAPGRRFDPARHGETACVAIVHDIAEAESIEASTQLLFSDVSPTMLEMALRSAMRARDAVSAMRGASIEFERRFLEARETSCHLVDDLAPIVRALDGLLELMGAESKSWPAGEGSKFALVRNWTRDLAGVIERHRQAAIGEPGERADLCAIVEKTLPQFEKRCARRRQTLVLSAPPAPLIAAIAPSVVQKAFHTLMESIFEREGNERRIDVLLWRSLDECRLAIVAGPATRRGAETAQAPVACAANDADTAFRAAIESFRALGATVDIVARCAIGSTIMIAMPAAI